MNRPDNLLSWQGFGIWVFVNHLGRVKLRILVFHLIIEYSDFVSLVWLLAPRIVALVTKMSRLLAMRTMHVWALTSNMAFFSTCPACFYSMGQFSSLICFFITITLTPSVKILCLFGLLYFSSFAIIVNIFLESDWLIIISLIWLDGSCVTWFIRF